MQTNLKRVLAKFNMNPDASYPCKPLNLIHMNRNQLAQMFADLHLDKGAEIGVEQGLYSEVLLRENPRLELYSIDMWKHYKGYRDHVNQEKLDRFYDVTVQRLSEYNTENFKRSNILRMKSTHAMAQFPDNHFDFVYIDGNHSFDYVMEDIIGWSRKVKSGGIIAGHDFIRRESVHVVQAVQAYTYCHDICPWFTVGGATKEVQSFFWIKP